MGLVPASTASLRPRPSSSAELWREREESLEVALEGGSEGMYQDIGELGPERGSTGESPPRARRSATSRKLVVILPPSLAGLAALSFV